MLITLHWGERQIRSISIIRRLLFEGDPLKVDPDFEWSTLMSLVASSRNLPAFESLISHFRNCNVLTIALQYTDPYGNDNALSVAIACNNLKIALRLIQLGSPLNNQNFSGFSPLHETYFLKISTKQQNIELNTALQRTLISLLLEKGTDSELLDRRNRKAEQLIE
jgi:hypothetical protein